MRSGIRSPMQNVRNYFHGTVADKIVREWLEDPERQPGTMVGRVAEMFDSEAERLANSDQGYVRWKSLSDRAEMQAKVERLLRDIEPWLVENILPHEFEPEVRFRFPISMPGLHGDVVVIMVGGIDMLVRTAEGDWHVWDLKATNNPSYWRASKGQLVFYGLAVQMGFPPHKVPTKTGLVQPLVPDAFEKVLELTDEDYSMMWSRMVKMLHDIQRGDFDYKDDTTGCDWCEVRRACTRFNPVNAFSRKRP
jgi:hypothetical protein